MSFRILFGFSILIICSCGDKPTALTAEKANTQSSTAQWQPPAAGMLVAEYKKPIDEDKLNKAFFEVKILSTESSDVGVFLMKFAHGFNSHEKELTFPKWPGNTTLKPVLKPGTEKYHCLVGFEAGDNQFHQFYEVKFANGDLSIKQTTGYYPQK